MRQVRVLSCVVGVAVASASGQLSFTESSNPRGMTMSHAGSFSIEFMSAGGAVGDFNRDGFQDVFVLGGGNGTDCLYINQGDGTFVDQAAAWGVAVSHCGIGACAGDYDGDGDTDLFVTSRGPAAARADGHHRLYRNNGNGTFTEVAASAGVQTMGDVDNAPMSGAFGDFDLDGDLDLAVAAWYGANRLFRNKGDGTFEDVTAVLNYDMTTVRGFSPRFVDMNGDRYPELLWVADFFTSKYFINNTDGTFTEATAAAGTGFDSNGMGNTQGDLDNDGDLDWYVTSRISGDGASGSGNMYYVNDDGVDHVYTESSISAGVNNGYWGWGADTGDFDHDGMLDIAATNGFFDTFALDPTRLWLNNGDGTFSEVSAAVGILHNGQGRGLVRLDIENDGDLDLIILSNDQHITLYVNNLTGPDTNWLRLFFDTSLVPDLAPDGVGTHVTLTAGGATQVRYVENGATYQATSELSAHFGLGASTQADSIVVDWANGSQTTLNNVAANATRTIVARNPCLADFDGDGDRDGIDIGLFLQAYGTGAVTADMDGDGDRDGIDVGLFLQAYGLGC